MLCILGSGPFHCLTKLLNVIEWCYHFVHTQFVINVVCYAIDCLLVLCMIFWSLLPAQYIPSSCLQLYNCSGIMDKVCAFCSRGEKSLLGQGELTCYEPTPGFHPFKRQLSRVGAKRALSEPDEITGRRGQQSLTWRRTRGPLRQQSRYAKSGSFFILLYLNHSWLNLSYDNTFVV